MKIGINASFARKSNTGIGQVTLNFLKKLSEFPISYLSDKQANFQFPNNFQISDFKNNGEKLEFVLYLEEDLSKDINFNLGKNFTKNVFLPKYKRDDLIRKIWWEKFCLPRRVKKDKCDVFISLYQCPTIFSKNIKHTMVVHDIVPKLFPEYLNNWRKKIYWKLTERAIKKADKIIAISEHTKKDLIKYLQISENKISVRYFDVAAIYKKEVSENELQRILKKYNLEKGYIYSGGGLEKRKNIDTLIYAYRKLLEKNKNIPFLVISGKLMPELSPLIVDVEKLVKELKLESKVKLLDFIPQKDLPALYKNSCMFIFPSRYEGFGMPPLEAMNQGVPVIMAKNSSLPEVGGNAVKYFNSENSKELAKKIKEILNNEGLRNELSQKGKEQAKFFS